MDAHRVCRCVAVDLPNGAGQASPISWLSSPGGNREPAGLIAVWQMCYPVQHTLDAAAFMASSATFRGIVLRAVSGCCYNNGGLRNRRWANAITKHGGSSKDEWQTSVQTLPLSSTCRHFKSTTALRLVVLLAQRRCLATLLARAIELTAKARAAIYSTTAIDFTSMSV